MSAQAAYFNRTFFETLTDVFQNVSLGIVDMFHSVLYRGQQVWNMCDDMLIHLKADAAEVVHGLHLGVKGSARSIFSEADAFLIQRPSSDEAVSAIINMPKDQGWELISNSGFMRAQVSPSNSRRLSSALSKFGINHKIGRGGEHHFVWVDESEHWKLSRLGVNVEEVLAEALSLGYSIA